MYKKRFIHWWWVIKNNLCTGLTQPDSPNSTFSWNDYNVTKTMKVTYVVIVCHVMFMKWSVESLQSVLELMHSPDNHLRELSHGEATPQYDDTYCSISLSLLKFIVHCCIPRNKIFILSLRQSWWCYLRYEPSPTLFLPSTDFRYIVTIINIRFLCHKIP